jgi:hypothetical protein
MDNTEYIYTDTTVKYSNSLPINDILELADIIWKDIKKLPNNDNSNDSTYQMIFDKYKDFGYSFPLILRWMVQLKKYSSKSFKKFLLKYSTANIESKKDFLILQAEYLVYLYKEDNKYDKNQVNLYREFIIKQLLEEDVILQELELELKKEEEINSENKRKKLYEYVINNKKN